jgi:hypothetical protein
MKCSYSASVLEGVECWSATELVENYFPDIRKTIPMPKGAEKETATNKPPIRRKNCNDYFY